jgi:hypothetical protein
MKPRLQSLIGKARQLESAIAARFEKAAARAAGSQAMQPLEIVQAIVADVEREIQPAGRGRQTFPFNDVRVVVVAPSTAARARMEALFEGPPSIADRIRERLTAAGCDAAAPGVHVAFVAKPRPDWARPEYHLELARVPTASRATPAARRRLELIVTKGTADRETYAFDAGPVTLGRGADVRSTRQRLLRVNHVAFVEGGGDINRTVSRCHAHIDAEPAGFRIFDDGSAEGTNVIRQGRGVPVPRGGRGLRLESGDEIVLGEACVRVRLHDILSTQ